MQKPKAEVLLEMRLYAGEPNQVRLSGAFSDIESGPHQYFFDVGSKEVDIHVVDGPTGKYLGNKMGSQ